MQDRLLRSRTDRVIGGVCGGLAHYFELDPVIVRLIFVLLAMGGGIGLVVYAILLAVIPSEKAQLYGQGEGAFPAPPGALPFEQQQDLWSQGAFGRPPFDPAGFRYDPYTGEPLRPTAEARVREVARPEMRTAATGQTIDLRRASSAQPSVTDAPSPAPPPMPVPPPAAAQPPYSQPVHSRAPRSRGDRRSQLGVLLLIAGALFLAAEFGIEQFFFPALLIIGGFLLLSRR